MEYRKKEFPGIPNLFLCWFFNIWKLTLLPMCRQSFLYCMGIPPKLPFQSFFLTTSHQAKASHTALNCGDAEFWHPAIHYFVFPSLYVLCEALLRSNWSNEGSIFARECVCECCFCASLEQTEGRTRAKNKKNTHADTHVRAHTHALKPPRRSGLIKKQCSDCRDCVKERMCMHVCVALGLWLKHDRPSNETMYSAGPQGFHLSIQTATSCGSFYGKKKLIISPTVTEQWDGKRERKVVGGGHWWKWRERLAHIMLRPDTVWESLIICWFSLIFPHLSVSHLHFLSLVFDWSVNRNLLVQVHSQQNDFFSLSVFLNPLIFTHWFYPFVLFCFWKPPFIIFSKGALLIISN